MPASLQQTFFGTTYTMEQVSSYFLVLACGLSCKANDIRLPSCDLNGDPAVCLLLNGFHSLDAWQANSVGPFPEDTACIAACKNI